MATTYALETTRADDGTVKIIPCGTLAAARRAAARVHARPHLPLSARILVRMAGTRSDFTMNVDRLN